MPSFYCVDERNQYDQAIPVGVLPQEVIVLLVLPIDDFLLMNIHSKRTLSEITLKEILRNK